MTREELIEAILEGYFKGKDQRANKIPSIHQGRLKMMAQEKDNKRSAWVARTMKAAKMKAPGGDIMRLPRHHKLRVQLRKAGVLA